MPDRFSLDFLAILILFAAIMISCGSSDDAATSDGDADSDSADSTSEQAEDSDDETDGDAESDGDGPAEFVGVDRPDDPVIIGGALLPQLEGVAPSDLAAFRFDGTLNGWVQIPLQVDERHVADYRTIYNDGSVPEGDILLAYSDPNTLTGPDPDPGIDPDDELVFMARDGGEKVEAADDPHGVLPGSGIEIALSDPTAPDRQAFIYLFTHDGSLQPDAGATLGDYTFTLLAGSYPEDYRFGVGPNPEDSWFKSSFYERRFVDRWVGDVMKIMIGDTPGIDILEIHNDQFFPGVCTRDVVVFSENEGAFVTNRQGPIRSIRSYIGAVSGPRTQRTHFFYEAREDIITDLRVHEIASMYDYFDFNEAAIGMIYKNSHYPEGVVIDGVEDEIGNEMPLWELITGEPGGLVILQRMKTNMDVAPNGYYRDQNPMDPKPCYGDDAALGLCGSELPILPGIPCTDPGMDCEGTLQAIRIVYYESSNATTEDAAEHARHYDEPLSFAISGWNPAR